MDNGNMVAIWALVDSGAASAAMTLRVKEESITLISKVI